MSDLMDRIESAYEEWFLKTYGQLPKQLVAENDALQQQVAELELRRYETVAAAEMLDEENERLKQRVTEFGRLIKEAFEEGWEDGYASRAARSAGERAWGVEEGWRYSIALEELEKTDE